MSQSRRIAGACMLALFPVSIIVGVFTRYVGGVVSAALLLVLAVSWSQVREFQCPRCGKPFFRRNYFSSCVQA